MIGEFVGEILLKEVNIINETDQQISGSIKIIAPDDNTVLEESFDLVPSGASEADDDEKNSAAMSVAGMETGIGNLFSRDAQPVV